MSLISVILPTYNSFNTLERAINSVLNQTYRNLELIVCDDRSNDNTLKVLKDVSKRDSRMRYIINKNNSGAGFSRNEAIKISIGNYIAFIDSDDEWYPEKLKIQYDYIIKHSLDICYTDTLIINKNFKYKKVAKPQITFLDMHSKNHIVTSSAVIKKQSIKRNFNLMRKRQDYLFWLKNMSYGLKAMGINETLTIYYVNEGSLSTSKKWFLPYYHFKIFYKNMNYSLSKSLYYLLLNILNKFKDILWSKF